MKGTIKRINDKGFGFITPEEGGQDVFFHANDCTDKNFTNMQEGNAVSFETADSPKGKKAVNVVLA